MMTKTFKTLFFACLIPFAAEAQWQFLPQEAKARYQVIHKEEQALFGEDTSYLSVTWKYEPAAKKFRLTLLDSASASALVDLAMLGIGADAMENMENKPYILEFDQNGRFIGVSNWEEVQKVLEDAMGLVFKSIEQDSTNEMAGMMQAMVPMLMETVAGTIGQYKTYQSLSPWVYCFGDAWTNGQRRKTEMDLPFYPGFPDLVHSRNSYDFVQKGKEWTLTAEVVQDTAQIAGIMTREMRKLAEKQGSAEEMMDPIAFDFEIKDMYKLQGNTPDGFPTYMEYRRIRQAAEAEEIEVFRFHRIN